MLVDGASPNPQAIELSPAQRAARRMEKLIHDQIDESNGSSELRNALMQAKTPKEAISILNRKIESIDS